MYSSSTLSSERWAPDHREWNEDAFAETRDAFFQTVVESPHQHAQAFALWALSIDPELSDEAVGGFQGGCSDGCPQPDDIQRAREAIERRIHECDSGEQAPVTVEGPQAKASKPARKRGKSSGKRASAKKSKKLSQLEKSVLAELEAAEKLIQEYREAESALERALAEFESAQQTLKNLDPLERELISRHDTEVAELLRRIDEN